jgi:predicted transcriptional regulator
MLEIPKVAEPGVKKTHIMYKVELSFDQLKRYLSALDKAGFINHQYQTWKTTEKALHTIEACELCQRLLEEVP